MDFFESQDSARRRTLWLLVLFGLAVLATMTLVYLAVSGVVLYYAGRRGGLAVGGGALLDPVLLAAVGSGTLAVVGVGSGYKIAQLRSGGAVVAAALGGRLVASGTTERRERRLLNVVEEMAIASGTPVPTVFVLENEQAINAFAAGYAPDDAVIGVTRGCIDRLSRDELQGVIAHEFSHILNGDMRMNIRLMGWLHGLLVIGLLGGMLLRGTLRAGRGRRGGGAVPILLVGAALVVVGYAGTFFGKIIKAAVSRQRELLADAAAVQFTRHPPGLVGALVKIGAESVGSRLRTPRAAEASHMYFAQGIAVHWHLLFATHPPLPLRIRRLDPGWNGRFDVADTPRDDPAPARAPADATDEDDVARDIWLGGLWPARALTRFDLGQAGRFTEPHVLYAAGLIDALPPPLRVAAQDPHGARAVVAALLLDDEAVVRARQQQALAELDATLAHDAGILVGLLDERCPPEARLPLLELAIAQLRELAPPQYETFTRAVDELIRADDRVDLFEWMLLQILRHAIEPSRSGRRPVPVRFHALATLGEPCAVLLAALARAGHGDEPEMRVAFERGASVLGLAGLAIPPPSRGTLAALEDALGQLAHAAPRLKRLVLQACVQTVAADGIVTVRQGELLRAIAATLGCPMPPLLPGQPLPSPSERPARAGRPRDRSS